MSTPDSQEKRLALYLECILGRNQYAKSQIQKDLVDVEDFDEDHFDPKLLSSPEELENPLNEAEVEETRVFLEERSSFLEQGLRKVEDEYFSEITKADHTYDETTWSLPGKYVSPVYSLERFTYSRKYRAVVWKHSMQIYKPIFLVDPELQTGLDS
ncbi:hypothetical protein PABG_02098 [Paracoccidioides brasiliensis Pb03]|nr:hypothetical protein PABG_02098 [Paracoccidioides brasiliensis Pb03]